MEGTRTTALQAAWEALSEAHLQLNNQIEANETLLDLKTALDRAEEAAIVYMEAVSGMDLDHYGHALKSRSNGH